MPVFGTYVKILPALPVEHLRFMGGCLTLDPKIIRIAYFGSVAQRLRSIRALLCVWLIGRFKTENTGCSKSMTGSIKFA